MWFWVLSSGFYVRGSTFGVRGFGNPEPERRTQNPKPGTQAFLASLAFGRSERWASREPIRVQARHRRAVDGSSKRFIVVERFEVWVAASERAILGIECDGPFEVRHRFRVLPTLRVRDREHVERVIVVG